MRLFLGLISLALASPAVAQNKTIVMTNGSGTVTTGGVSRPVFPQNGDRNYLFCQNPIDATETLYVDYGRPAAIGNGSVELAPGGSVSFLAAATPIEAVSVNAATTGHRFICKSGANN